MASHVRPATTARSPTLRVSWNVRGTQREDAVDDRVGADDPPDQRAQRDRDARDGRRIEQRERSERHRGDDHADLQVDEVADVTAATGPRQQRGQDDRAPERHRERAGHADGSVVPVLDEEARRGQAVHREQCRHDREARSDGGRAPVVAADAGNAEDDGEDGAQERCRRHRIEVHVRDVEGRRVVRHEEGHDGRQADGDSGSGRGEDAYAVHPARIGTAHSRLERPSGTEWRLTYTPAGHIDEGSRADGGRHGVHVRIGHRGPSGQDRRSDLRRGAGCGPDGRSDGASRVRDAGHDRPRPGRRRDHDDGDAGRPGDRRAASCGDRLHERGRTASTGHLRGQVALDQQSPDIAQGVDAALEARSTGGDALDRSAPATRG